MRPINLIALVLVFGCGPSVGTTHGEGTTGSGQYDDGPRPVTGAPQTTATPMTTPATTSATSGSTGPVDPSCGDFIGCPGDAFDGQCSTWDEDCPAGEKCMPWANDGGNAWNALKCVPIDDNPNAPGEPCTVEGSGVSGIDDCDFHAMCWNVNPDTNTGTCVAMCVGSPDVPGCAQLCHECLISGSGVLNLCLPNCDPLMQNCGADEVCVSLSGSSFACVFGSGGAPTVIGSPCGFISECSAGQFCTDGALVPGCTAGDGCCTAFCSTAADTCPAGMHCEAWTPAPDACSGGPTVGACVAD